MLTTVAAGRVYSFSHAVGGNAVSGPGFVNPAALAIGPDCVVYVVSRSNENDFAMRISKITIGAPGDEEFICEFGKYSDKYGQLVWPTSVALDQEGNVYASDEWIHCITIFDKDGNFLDKWGIPGAMDGELNRPAGIIFDSEDNLLIADSANNRVQKLSKDGTFLAKFGIGGSGEGQFNLPWGITIDSQGGIYVADWKTTGYRSSLPMVTSGLPSEPLEQEQGS